MKKKYTLFVVLIIFIVLGFVFWEEIYWFCVGFYEGITGVE